MKKLNYILYAIVLLSIFNCKEKEKTIVTSGHNEVDNDIVSTIINDKESFYHIDFLNYPKKDKSLPIGVFDSGIGGLTVLKAIVAYDENNNGSKTPGSDGVLDFNNESFIYLADQANMPYGNYSGVQKVDLLKEHIIKDTQFLMGNKYYSNQEDTQFNIDKKPVKVIVIACNTATAYGKEHIEEFIKKAGSDIKIIGVIDAGVRGVLATMKKDEDGIIGVMATAGTVGSKGYETTILNLKEQLVFTGNIEVFSQGGIGIAEAVDEDTDYFNKNLKKPRQDYKGPSLTSATKIDKTLFDIYNFDFKDSKMLCDTDKADDCSILQINDPENYVRYHVVTLLENIRKSKTNNQLKSIILGCTHYPFLLDEIKVVLNELYHYKGKDGQYLYQKFMAEDIKLVDPAINTAKELYEYLNEKSLFNVNGNIEDSEFYISVANQDNKNTKIDADGRFPYDYKYGRNAGQIQEYIKNVPFSRNNISEDILTRLETQIPNVYQLIQGFNSSNEKVNFLDDKDKI
ncbi:aspartate/glutamate racemase family protein [Cellulophaga sp. E16_2]|uniref:glutamate racemase n=1 Tax=Cellulophaga sp. E16_2 TaxID=2789297 RepID=UPI001A90F43E|nr:aspartate/glutamate racemase family protein [Cellulophaga sp. E16_2]MBO0592908.1 aspartate/glutamate racemase family protein [Cellulophaga sp. E16_2]